MLKLYFDSCPVCGGRNHYLTMAVTDGDADYIKDWDRIAREIYDGTFKGPYDVKMAKWLGGKITEAVLEGMGKSYEELEFNSPQKDMADHLLTNAYQFSVAKNYTDMKDLTAKLIDPETNKVRTWTEYKKQVSSVMDASNKFKFRTEYNFAVAAAQNATRWATFEEDSNLKYLTSNDSLVRDSHKVLHGLVYAKDDAFWNTHYPPNGWGCRCYAIETTGEVTSADKAIPHVDTPDMFKVNLAREKLLYPEDHPYFKGMPKELVTEADKLNPYLSILEYQSTINKKGKVNVVPLCHNEKDTFENTLKTAKRWADAGHELTLYPSTRDKNLRKIYFDDRVKKDKCPDTKLVGEWFDLKYSHKATKASIFNHIRKGKLQADNLALFIDDDTPIETIERFINGKFHSSTHGHGTLNNIWIANKEHEKYTTAKEIWDKYKKQKASAN